MNKFNIEKIIKKVGEILFPKEVLIGIGIMIFVIFIVFMTNNIYVEEMLMLEGVMKSTPIYTEEELREYGEIYKELEKEFAKEISEKALNYANRTNRIGEKIRWGVYGGNNSEDLINEDFVDGVEIKYVKTKGREEGESNLIDILSAISIIVDQKQSKVEKEENKKLIKELYKMSHTYSGKSSDLYPCERGCYCDYYRCSDAISEPMYKDSKIKYSPFKIEGHEEYEDYKIEEFDIEEIKGECEVCIKDETKEHYEKCGCEEVGMCYHGDEENHNMGGSKPTEEECKNWNAVQMCSYEGEGEHDCSEEEIGCGGYYECLGHTHYECPNGHYYICCMGHTNLTITIRIMYIDEILKEISK